MALKPRTQNFISTALRILGWRPSFPMSLAVHSAASRRPRSAFTTVLAAFTPNNGQTGRVGNRSLVTPTGNDGTPSDSDLHDSLILAHGRTTPLTRLVSDDVLDAAYGWLCRRRRDYPANSDVWSFRRDRALEKQRIRSNLLAGRYCFDLLDRITLADGSDIDLWSSRDALVLKALTMVLSDVLPVSSRCTHVKGHGGAKDCAT
jgi:hypothetical protein